MEKKSTKVCVTGAAGYIGSWLVKKLLERGHVVHATLRNIGDPSKTGLLKNLPGAESRLLFFQADINYPDQFEPAIQGCEFVFLLATPMDPFALSCDQLKNIPEASVAAIRSIMNSCERAESVKRVIYTGSVTASSPLKEDGTGFKDFIDESCWTPLGLSFAHGEAFEKGYMSSKTLSEKEILSYNSREGSRRIEVVSLVCGLVGGDALLPYLPLSLQVIVSPLTGEPVFHRVLKFLHALLCPVPLVHIEDVCEAHVFCMERPSMAGRFICASASPTMKELVDYYEEKYPELIVNKEVVGTERRIECRSTKLVEMGFEHTYDEKQIIDGSVEVAKRLGNLKEVINT